MDAEIKQAISLASREVLARIDYEHYFRVVNQSVKLYPHVKYIISKLQKIIDGEQHFYIVEMPPQHGKSLTITKTFPGFYLMKNPEKRVMVTAYSEALYREFSNENRKKFTYWAPKLYGLETRSNQASYFDIKNHRGSFFATSMLGGATGKSADLLIIDDPVKNAEEAGSKTIKDKIWDEWTQTFYPRLQKGGSVIVIMTRWQQDDLAGRLLQKMSLPWEEIKLPAISEDIPAGKTDEIGRKNGEALCPELHPLEELLTHKHDMGTQAFTALYQQRPTIEGGNVFRREWVKFYVPDRETLLRLGLTDKDAEIAPIRYDRMYQSWDATFKGGDNDDFVAGQTWGIRDANYYLQYHFTHERLSFTQTLTAIRDMTRRYPKARAKYIEDKANGSAIIDTLRREISGIIPINPDGGKLARASAVSPIWEAGNVYVPHPLWCPQIEDWLEEIFNFPNAPHDDNVDSMTQGINATQRRKKVINRFL